MAQPWIQLDSATGKLFCGNPDADAYVAFDTATGQLKKTTSATPALWADTSASPPPLKYREPVKDTGTKSTPGNVIGCSNAWHDWTTAEATFETIISRSFNVQYDGCYGWHDGELDIYAYVQVYDGASWKDVISPIDSCTNYYNACDTSSKTETATAYAERIRLRFHGYSPNSCQVADRCPDGAYTQYRAWW